MRQLYETIESLLQAVDFEGICPGFRRWGFGLYNSARVWLADRVIPRDRRFVGNTAIAFEGEYLAVFQVEDPRETDAELLAADLVHEMFHAYQMSCGESRYPDDFKLLCYPDNMENYRLKYAENRLLAMAMRQGREHRPELLAAFRAVRESRKRLAGDWLEQELLAEHIEGRAEYAGCKALQSINPRKYEERLCRYLEKLETVDESFFDMRRQAYITGAVYGLACGDWGEADPIKAEARRYRRAQEARIQAFLGREPVRREGDYLICGYDPMNMIKSGRMVLCSHFAALQAEGEKLFLNGPVLLELKEEGSREVEAFWLEKGCGQAGQI